MEDWGSYEDLFLSNLELVEKVIAFTSRRQHLSLDEAEDFGGYVRLRLIENDYAVFRKFAGRSSLKTYLSTVIQRHLLDFRASRWGKWRPSATAQRLGPVAVRLEELTQRDDYSLEEAWQILGSRYQIRENREQIDAIAAQLPPRRASHHEKSLEELQQPPTSADDPEREAVLSEQAERQAALARRLGDALEQLSEENRLILKMRFEDSFTVAEIARTLNLQQRPLYRRIERLLRTLREHLESQGIAREVVLEILGDQFFRKDPERRPGRAVTTFAGVRRDREVK